MLPARIAANTCFTSPPGIGTAEGHSSEPSHHTRRLHGSLGGRLLHEPSWDERKRRTGPSNVVCEEGCANACFTSSPMRQPRDNQSGPSHVVCADAPQSCVANGGGQESNNNPSIPIRELAEHPQLSASSACTVKAGSSAAPTPRRFRADVTGRFVGPGLLAAQTPRESSWSKRPLTTTSDRRGPLFPGCRLDAFLARQASAVEEV